MSGYCEVDFSDVGDDADPCEFVDYRTVKARKAHSCAACGGVIAVGERHQVVAYKFDGQFGYERTCEPCLEACGEFGYTLVGGTGVWEMLAEEWDNGAHVQACINRLSTARAKEHMRQQWFRWKERQVEAEAKRQRRLAELRKTADAVDPQVPDTGNPSTRAKG